MKYTISIKISIFIKKFKFSHTI